MAANVFGTPITTATVQAMPEYETKIITRQDRAQVALNMRMAENKDINAREYVENLKRQYGNGVSTLCLIYNATGDSLNFVTHYDWYGRVWRVRYPQNIANGQWGAFLHTKRPVVASGSVAAIVYRGLNNDDSRCDWMASWSNPWFTPSRNRVFTQVREEGHFGTSNRWNNVYNILVSSGIYGSDSWNGCVSQVTTGIGTSPIFEGIFTLTDVGGLTLLDAPSE